MAQPLIVCIVRGDELLGAGSIGMNLPFVWDEMHVSMTSGTGMLLLNSAQGGPLARQPAGVTRKSPHPMNRLWYSIR